MKNFILLSFLFFLVSLNTFSQTSNEELLQKVEARFIEILNEKRAAKKLSTLEVSECLQQAAKHHSIYLVQTNKFTHQEKGLKLPSDRVLKYCNQQYKVSIENILMVSFKSDAEVEKLAQRFYKMWYDSPGHKANMFEKNINQAGIGSSISKKGELIVTFVGAKF